MLCTLLLRPTLVLTGYYSWRNSVRGSWFIQALCDVLERYAGGQHPSDLLSMMTRVCRRVAYEFESNVDNAVMSRKKQVRNAAHCTQLFAHVIT